jgi:hypothetical protein
MLVRKHPDRRTSHHRDGGTPIAPGRLSAVQHLSDNTTMTRTLCTLLLVVVLVGAVPRRAAADATAFWGLSPTASARSARGFAVGVSLLVVGFEFEYASTAEDELELAPALRTGMINALIQTPTRTQFYLTAGGGFYRERLAGEGETHFGTNIGGGVKLPLTGPLRLRLDYRVFNLRGSPIYKSPQRFYAGLNLSF